MRKHTRATRAPVVEPLRLHDLEDADVDALRDQELHEGLRLHGGDLTGRTLNGATFSECELSGLRARELDLRSARLLETRLDRLDVPVVHGARLVLRDVELADSRIGAFEVHDAELRSTRIRGGKIDWLNLRGSTLENVIVEDCTIGELDLMEATAVQVAFVGCRAESVTFTRTRCTHVDLRGLTMGTVHDLSGVRGTTIGMAQLIDLTEPVAAHLGIRLA